MKFSEKVYNLVKQIPIGYVSTYRDVAHALNSKAYRAVGQALNRNPYAPFVACHRVVASNGNLHGFASGLKNKRLLLEKEGVKVKNNKVMNFDKILLKF